MYPYYAYRPQQGISGRTVTNIEEARAAQIDLDGSMWYFPCPSANKIYCKSINMQGMPVFQEYELKTPVIVNPVDTLMKRLEILETQVKELTNNEPADANA